MLAVIAGMSLLCAESEAQRARFGDFFASQASSPIPAPASTLQGFSGASQTPSSIITTPPIQLTPPPARLQQPNFSPGTFQQPGLAPQSGLPNIQLPDFGTSNLATPSFDPYQSNQSFPIFPQGQQFNPQQLAAPQFGQQYGAPNQYPYQGTGSNWQPAIDWSWPKEAWQSFSTDFLPRVLERPRARQTYLPGGDLNSVDINDIELASTATWPNFLQGPTPLRITPGFVFHFWNGPDSTLFPDFDLPPQAYSSYLAFDHVSDPSKLGGLETNFTIGYYSDFDNTSSDAIRLQGKLVGWYRVNQYTIGKFGVEYLDRVKVKLLPAFGVYLTPNPDLKLDLFFPKTKLAQRIPNINNLEAWAYVGGEYGGGSWAIERRDGTPDQADLNDVRAFVGLEWMGTRRVTGFAELGYVFDRELLYRSDPANALELRDTIMLRSGFAF